MAKSKNTKEAILRWKEKGTKVLASPPKGYKKTLNATTSPRGYAWYNNGESLFSGKRKSVLVKIKDIN